MISIEQRFQDGCVRGLKWFRRGKNYFIAARVAGFKRKTARRRPPRESHPELAFIS
jgi:hypothetical protein